VVERVIVRNDGVPDVESMDMPNQLLAGRTENANVVELASDVVAVASTVMMLVPAVFGADVLSSILNTALVADET
jgi:hypothetical protein